jgi:hypothetical protein
MNLHKCDIFVLLRSWRMTKAYTHIIALQQLFLRNNLLWVVVVDLPINSKLYWQQSCQLSIALSCSTAIVPTWFIVLELCRIVYTNYSIYLLKKNFIFCLNVNNYYTYEKYNTKCIRYYIRDMQAFKNLDDYA